MALKANVELELNDIRFYDWESISLKRSLNAISGISITMPNPAGLRSTLPSEDMPIRVRAGWGSAPPVQFDGYMDDPSWSVQNVSMRLGLTGRDFGKILFDEQTVDNDFVSYGNPIGQGYIFEYLTYLAAHLTHPVDTLFSRNTEDDNDSSFQYEFGYEKVLEEATKLCGYGGYEWYMGFDTGGNRKWFVRKPRDLVRASVSHAFIVGDRSRYSDIPTQASIHHIGALSVKKQYGFKKNYTKVQGSGVSAVYPLTPPSTPKHLYHEDDGIVTSGGAQQVALRLWQQRSAPKVLVDFSGIGVETLRVGDIIYVNDSRYGLAELSSHIFRLIDISDTFTKEGWTSTFKVADFSPNIFEFFNDTSGL